MFKKYLSNDILNALLSVIEDAVSIVDLNGNVLYWNKGAEKLYDVRECDIVGESIATFFNERNLIILDTLKTENLIRDEYHQPQSGKHVLISSSPIYDEHNCLRGAISIEKDISQTVKLNEQLLDTSKELRLLKNQIENKANYSPFSHIIGNSEAIKQTILLAKRVANTDATVYIFGESGVGKEIFAHAIHEASDRCQQPFVPINCGAIPHALFESELFGYEKGAFSGASSRGKPGKMELAHQGTLFLDEVAELPLTMQVKLLRALQENQIFRIGGTTPIYTNVRILAATNKDLLSMVKKGTFRSDLYYRLNVFPINIPPLRKRIEDIPYLISSFFHEFSNKHDKHIPTITQDALDYLTYYDWPGNIRELRNIIERLVILNDSSQVTLTKVVNLLPVTNLQKGDQNSSFNTNQLKNEIEMVEKNKIVQTLQNTYGNKSAAAKKLGISRSTLYKRIKQYGIK